MKPIKLLAAVAALGCAIGTAQAQHVAGTLEASPYMPPNAGALTENATVRNPGDTAAAEIERARDAAIARQRDRRSGTVKVSRVGPADAADIKAGSDVWDSKGVLVGRIEEVTLSVAVLHADGGKVEVPLEAFGKNDRGLLIGMTKAEFDALVAQASKPAA